jgi:hypothetical protein
MLALPSIKPLTNCPANLTKKVPHAASFKYTYTYIYIYILQTRRSYGNRYKKCGILVYMGNKKDIGRCQSDPFGFSVKQINKEFCESERKKKERERAREVGSSEY